MTLEKQYQWLLKEQGPIMIKKALALYDTKELSGTPNNPVIINWANEVGGDVANVYKADEIPWCGLFTAVVAKRGSKQVVKDPLWALNWGNFGKHIDVPMLGDVLVFVRKTSDGKTAGHVALYVGEDDSCYHVLGGNQSDKVCIARKDKTRLYTSRRPNYNIQPNNVRQIFLSSTGEKTGSEQ
ncbi:TIGR02594 family protein [Flavobacterium restrictum]|uniref:TIGR02594 family protein n=1 Tax=Flavobacterium restrictum TaxID=2594428 RepID=A0A553E2F8_9FLAO|nr:TIGR02594 family protein [Flavobacterium restrictum]TRX39231.1 TIGR02594 family protein [Flavobacterium restrictum]